MTSKLSRRHALGLGLGAVAMPALLRGTAHAQGGRVVVGKVDVDANPQTAARYEVRGIPTVLVFDHGQVVDRLVGVQPRAVIEARLAPLLSAAR